MARPKKSRTVCFEPDITEFIKIKNNREFVEITVDEYETLRLIDYMGLTQMECALQMQVARSTIASIYESARYKISDSLVNGKAIKVRGGDYNICPNSKTCCGGVALMYVAGATTVPAKNARANSIRKERNVI